MSACFYLCGCVDMLIWLWPNSSLPTCQISVMQCTSRDGLVALQGMFVLSQALCV